MQDRFSISLCLVPLFRTSVGLFVAFAKPSSQVNVVLGVLISTRNTLMSHPVLYV